MVVLGLSGKGQSRARASLTLHPGLCLIRECALLPAALAMYPEEKDRHDGKLEVHTDYVCLPTEYHDLDSLNDLVQKPLTEIAIAYTSAKPPYVSERRQWQELLSASLYGSGSAFIFSTPPRSASVDGLYVRVVRIEETRAYLGDDAALAALLAGLSIPPFVEPLLHKPFFERRWDCAKRRDHWIASDGTMVVSLMISGASASDVAGMRARFDDLRIVSPRLQPSLMILHDLLEELAPPPPGHTGPCSC